MFNETKIRIKIKKSYSPKGLFFIVYDYSGLETNTVLDRV